MIRKILLSGILLTLFMAFTAGTLSAQGKKKLDFKYVEQIQDSPYKSVVFTVMGNTCEESTKTLISSLSMLNGVKSVKIFYNRRVKILATEVPDALEVRLHLLKSGFDIDPLYVEVYDKVIYSEMLDMQLTYPVKDYVPSPRYEYSYPSSFPVFKDTGNPEADKKVFNEAKQQWIEDHPEEWKAMTGLEYLDYSVKLNKKN